jgi:hypothetical protein
MAWSDCLLNPVSCVAGSIGENAATSAWDSFLSWSARGLSDLSATVFERFSTSTAPRFDQQWWRDNLDLMAGVSLPILVAVFVLQCLSAVVRREPGRFGHAALGALLGTAGVPLAVGVIATCGTVADEISAAFLDGSATADGIKRMTELGTVLTVPTFGGFALLAVELGLVAMFSLYVVMLLREVALLAFVVFAPIAMISWTWSATRHWLRRWIEVVAALLFSKVAMAVVFTLGFSAVGAAGQGNMSNLGTFIAGILLIAMAAFTPLATYSFVHWAGDQGQAATQVLRQGAAGVGSGQEQRDRVQQWRAEHFGGSESDESPPAVGGDNDPNDESMDEIGNESHEATDQTGDLGKDQEPTASPTQPGSEAPPSQPSGEGAGAGAGSTAIAVATSEVSVDGQPEGAPESDADHSTDGRG